MRKKLIVAAAENGVIGNQGKIPWYISDDLKRFRDLTTKTEVQGNQNSLIMGSETCLSIFKEGKAFLPGRTKIVLSRKRIPEISALLRGLDDSFVVPSLEAAYELADHLGEKLSETAWIIGGAQVYQEAINLGDISEVYETKIYAEYEGDAVVKLDHLERYPWHLIGLEYYGDKDPRYEYRVYDNVRMYPEFYKIR